VLLSKEIKSVFRNVGKWKTETCSWLLTDRHRKYTVKRA
jgi:hypothetical protein